MQSVSSRIWTRVAVSISYDDNHHTTDTSLHHGHLRLLLLYNDSWHGFSVRPWWPRVLCHGVTFWLVNRGMAGRSDLESSQKRVERGICNRSEAQGRLWRYGLQGSTSVGTSWLQEEVPARSMYLHLSQIYNKLCAPIENKMREREIFL